MGYALVSAGTVASGLSPAFGQSTAAGNLLIAWLTSNSSSATNPFSTSSTGWLLAAAGGSAFEWSGIFYKPSSSAGETAPTFSGAGGSSFSQLAEFSGGAAASPLDQTAGPASGSTPVTVTAGAADTAAADLIVSCCYFNGGNAGPTTVATTITDSNGTSLAVTQADNHASTGSVFYSFAWGAAGGTLGASKDSATTTLGVFSNGGACLASFLASVSSSPPGTIQPRATVTVPRRRPARAGAWDSVAGPGNAAPAPPAPPAVIMQGRSSRLVETYRLTAG